MKVFTESGAVSLQIYVGLSELSHYSINSCSAVYKFTLGYQN